MTSKIYKNISDLSATQIKIFEVLINIENYKKTQIEQANLADVDIKTFRKWTRDDNFMDFVNKETDKYINKNLYRSYMALFDNSLLEGKNGDASRKLILEINNRYTNKIEVNNTGDLRPLIIDFNKSSEEDIKHGTKINSKPIESKLNLGDLDG